MNVALRGEAALRARLPKEARNNAAISPCESPLPVNLITFLSWLQPQMKWLGCTEELMQCT